jgi:hypothetical protein
MLEHAKTTFLDVIMFYVNGLKKGYHEKPESIGKL